MVGDYNIECCLGIKHTECINIIFRYLEKENSIDKIHLLLATPSVLETVKSHLSQSSLQSKAIFRSYKDIDNCDELRKKYKTNNTIYLYLDDDICYIAPNAIQQLVTWHINNKHIISYPSIANTGTTTFIWQIMGILPVFKTNNQIEDTDYYWTNCAKLSLAQITTIHEKFINAIKNQTNLSFYQYYLYRAHEMYKQFYVWTGGENCLTPCANLFEQYPDKFCINGELLASHFAFQSHRHELNKSNLITQYSSLLSLVD